MPRDKGAEFNKRVWSLFEKAGFTTKPNSTDPAEHVVSLADGRERPVDLLARHPDLGIAIIGSNKARNRAHGLTAHIHDLKELRGVAEADCALFVSEKEMQASERSFANRHGVKVWDERELSYYEAVADAIGYYAKYEIIHSLGLSTEEETLKHTVLGIRLTQPRPRTPSSAELFMFTLPADTLLRMCVVLRKAQGSAFTYQRILSARRLPRIGGFVQSPDALLPTNVVVHLGDGVMVEDVSGELRDSRGGPVILSRRDHQLVSLTFPLRYGSLELIDGQHRLFGFVHADDGTRKNFNLVVLGLKSLPEQRRSRTFVAINDHARRVDANLVSYLRYTGDERTCKRNADLMAIKIVVELNRMSPFKDSIRLFDFGRQKLTLKGLSGYDLVGLVSPNGLLRSHYPTNSSRVYVRVLRTYFSVIKEHFPTEWDDPATFIVATNRGVTAFLKLLRSILKTEDRPITRPIAKKYISALRRHWPDVWETRELRASYVGSQGWKRFHLDMVKAIRKSNKLLE